MKAIIARNWPEIRHFTTQHGARNVRLFGSVARGEETYESDIDLLVDLEPGRTLLDLIAIKQDIGDLLGRDIDVVTEASLSPYIRENILREAVAIDGR